MCRSGRTSATQTRIWVHHKFVKFHLSSEMWGRLTKPPQNHDPTQQQIRDRTAQSEKTQGSARVQSEPRTQWWDRNQHPQWTETMLERRLIQVLQETTTRLLVLTEVLRGSCKFCRWLLFLFYTIYRFKMRVLCPLLMNTTAIVTLITRRLGFKTPWASLKPLH